ncbi:MAG: (2Fe-2S)-binding protein [Acidimicrobiia bacterium]|nr:(2Fe-2S)-binding protein [Acidimicrobiia bacterium]
MAKVNIGDRSFEVADGTRLVLALEDNGVDILHLCGGRAQCTSCRVSFTDGEPFSFSVDELKILETKGLIGEFRLSCQILASHSMALSAPLTVSGSKFDSAGPRPTEGIVSRSAADTAR